MENIFAIRYPDLAEKLHHPDKNTLAARFPELTAEWHPTKNGDLTPDQVTPGSHKKVWWLGKCGHEWQATIYNRSSGNGCIYCSGQKVLDGFNDLATVKMELAAEWHPTKNGDLTPRDITPGSNKKVWWLGKCGHEWQATIYSRSKGSKCPHCIKERQTSFPEQAILYYLKKVTSAESRNKDFGKEIDVYLPELRSGVEYNGFWHKGRGLADYRKVEYLASLNIRIITINEAEKNCIIGDVIKYAYNPTQRDGLNWAITALFNMLNLPLPEIDASADELAIYDQYVSLRKEKSPTVEHPGIAAEWHPTKNRHLTPDMVSSGCNKRVWWMCALGHEWQAKVYHRTAGSSCPYCSGQKAWVGFNDLDTVKPELAAEWHPTKNGDLTPQEVTCSSHKKVWWLGKCGHEWQAVINNRSKGSGCPYCSGRSAIPGETDLATTNPELAAEWHPTRNGDLTPRDVTPGSNKKVWWMCEKGHEWQTVINNRTHGKGCPYCSGRSAILGGTDLATTNPELAAEWHPTKNRDLTPRDITSGSNKKVWWLGKCGHEWQARIFDRVGGKGCPECYKASRGKKRG